MNITRNDRLQIPLYHGTSTLFVDGISTHGLGGQNPVKNWNLIELAREVRGLAEKHLTDTETFRARHDAFIKMTDPVAGARNWQHGDTYLSPSKTTAIRYAIGKRFGSELLTYTLYFLQELVRMDIAGVKDELYQRYREAFGLLETCPSPVVIAARQIPIASLLGEDGGVASVNLKRLEKIRRNDTNSADILAQQINFRLQQPVSGRLLRFWMINVALIQIIWGHLHGDGRPSWLPERFTDGRFGSRNLRLCKQTRAQVE